VANRLTKGKGLFGALVTSNNATVGGSLAVTGALNVTGAVASAGSAVNIADGASMVATGAGILAGISTATLTQARTVTTATAALIQASLTGYVVGNVYEWTYINLAATHVATIAGGSNVTIVGLATVAGSQSATFSLRISSPTAMVLYRKSA